MISIGDMNASAMPPSTKKRMTLSVWAMPVVVALCMDPSVSSNIKDIPGEVIAAHKLVLDVMRNLSGMHGPGKPSNRDIVVLVL